MNPKSNQNQMMVCMSHLHLLDPTSHIFLQEFMWEVYSWKEQDGIVSRWKLENLIQRSSLTSFLLSGWNQEKAQHLRRRRLTHVLCTRPVPVGVLYPLQVILQLLINFQNFSSKNLMFNFFRSFNKFRDDDWVAFKETSRILD